MAGQSFGWALLLKAPVISRIDPASQSLNHHWSTFATLMSIERLMDRLQAQQPVESGE
jgi:hypothetical protein